MLILLNPLILYTHMYRVVPLISLSMETITFFCLLMIIQSLYGFTFCHTNRRFFPHLYNFIKWSKHNSIQPSRVCNQSGRRISNFFLRSHQPWDLSSNYLSPHPWAKQGCWETKLLNETRSLWRKDSHSFLTLLLHIPSGNMPLKQTHTYIIEP